MSAFSADVNPKPRKEQVRVKGFSVFDGDSEFDKWLFHKWLFFISV